MQIKITSTKEGIAPIILPTTIADFDVDMGCAQSGIALYNRPDSPKYADGPWAISFDATPEELAELQNRGLVIIDPEAKA